MHVTNSWACDTAVRARRFGNRWEQNSLAGGVPAPQLSFDDNNHIVGASYDASGDLLGDAAGHSYAYNANHRIVSADSGNIQYIYNAFGQRVEKSVGGAAKYYLYDPAGRAVTVLDQSGNWLRGEIFAGGRHIATYVNGTTYFDYSDWLGTLRMSATPAGYAQSECTSGPFGEGMSCAGSPTPLQFTGQQHDNETGLDHFPARNYTSTWARWMVPDWSPVPTAVPYANFLNPQTLDLYVYASDNPVTRTDAGGHCPVCVLEELETLAESVGGGAATGSATGAEVGAAAGTLVEPGGGTAAGGVSGGVIGGIAGAAAGAVGYVIYRLGHVAKSGNPTVPAVKQGKPGPSGKPMVHTRPSPTRKRALDAARSRGTGAPIEHSNPRKGLPHFRPARKNGEKIPGCHYTYPCR